MVIRVVVSVEPIASLIVERDPILVKKREKSDVRLEEAAWKSFIQENQLSTNRIQKK